MQQVLVANLRTYTEQNLDAGEYYLFVIFLIFTHMHGLKCFTSVQFF